MDGEDRKVTPPIEVLDRIEAIRGLVIEELTLMLPSPVPAGRFEDRGSEGVRSLEPDQGHHAAHRHAADRHPLEIEPDAACGGRHVIDLRGRLFDIVQQSLRPHSGLGPPFPVAGEVDGTTPDACAGEPEISAGIQLLGGGPAMHPDQEGDRTGRILDRFLVRADQEAGHAGPQMDVF